MKRRNHELDQQVRAILTSSEYYAFAHALETVVDVLKILTEREPALARRLVSGRLKPLAHLDLSDDARNGLEQFVEALVHAGRAVPPLGTRRQAKVTLIRRTKAVSE